PGKQTQEIKRSVFGERFQDPAGFRQQHAIGAERRLAPAGQGDIEAVLVEPSERGKRDQRGESPPTYRNDRACQYPAERIAPQKRESTEAGKGDRHVLSKTERRQHPQQEAPEPLLEK